MKLVGIFARHPTAANLLMALMIVAGVVALARLNTQFFPDFGIDVVRIGVDWPGAGAEDVDANIVQAIEPEVRFLDGVKRVRSISTEGHADIVIQFMPGTDMQAALADVETAVGQVTTLPEDSEKPIIERVVRFDKIARILISGPYSEAALKAFAKDIREDLLARGIDKVELIGARDEEIWAEVAPETLHRLDLSVADIAQAIARTSQDVPLGDTEGAGRRQVRSLGLVKTARELGRIAVRSRPGGEKIYLRDIATVREAFEDGGVTVRRDGQPAIELFVQRSVNADALEVANVVDRYLAEARARLPANLRIEQYDVAANLIRGRIDLLLRNGLGGLILVVAILFVFLNGRVAFWVAAGIPVSLMATLAVMLASGQSINMVSLFGLIMALGIIVDDAIVVGEHAETLNRAGMPPLEAAEAGARRMAAPVISASLTTIAAFAPLLAIGDIIGEIIAAIPFVAISVLIASLVECFLVLPGHMRGALAADGRRPWRARAWFDRRFAGFRDGPFRRLVAACVGWRYLTLAGAVAALIVAFGLVAGGRVGFVFFPSPETDWIYANVRFVAGTPRETTERMLAEAERSLNEAATALVGQPDKLVRLAVAKVGTTMGRKNTRLKGDNVGSVTVELVPTDRRAVTAEAMVAAWRERLKPEPGIESIAIFAVRGGPPGRDIDVRLAGEDVAQLKAGAGEVAGLLARYPGVSDVEDDLAYGKRETVLSVNARGRALGFTTESVARQVRGAFEGTIAKRFPRGDEEVTVRVRFPRAAAGPAALDALYLRGPDGAQVPLAEVVDVREKQGFARIKREDGVRQVAITAELDKSVATNDDILAALTRDGVGDIAARHDARFHFAGKAEEQAKTIGDMRTGAVVGLAAIYIVLAWVFASYTRPLVVMSVIPLAFVGSVFGHLVMGYDLTILSLVALVGLSGIVVNDSIILVTTIDERIGLGEPIGDAIVDGTRDRLRAVLLTSATTIGGLAPLMFETSLQAQFLIPMAVTIVFGLMVTTLLVLLVVPAAIAVQNDIGRRLRPRPPAPLEPLREAAE